MSFDFGLEESEATKPIVAVAAPSASPTQPQPQPQMQPPPRRPLPTPQSPSVPQPPPTQQWGPAADQQPPQQQPPPTQQWGPPQQPPTQPQPPPTQQWGPAADQQQPPRAPKAAWEPPAARADVPSSSPPLPQQQHHPTTPVAAAAFIPTGPHRPLMHAPRPLPLALPGSFWMEKSDVSDELLELLRKGGFEAGEECRHEENEEMHAFVRITATDGEPEDKLRPFGGSEVADFFAAIREPFAMITVCGDTRVGKSTLLNEFLATLGFAPSFGTSGLKRIACTAGIWFLPKLLEVRGCKFILVDMEGLAAIAVNGRTDLRYFQKLFVSSFLLSSTMLFLVRSAAIDQTLFDRLKKLAETVQAFFLQTGTQENLAANSPTFAIVAQDWAYRELAADAHSWLQNVGKAPKELKDLFGNDMRFGQVVRFFSTPYLQDPQRSKKVKDILYKLVQDAEQVSVLYSKSDQAHKVSPEEFLSVVRAVIDAVNSAEGIPTGEVLVDGLRSKARRKAFEAALEKALEAQQMSGVQKATISPQSVLQDARFCIDQVQKQIDAIFACMQPREGDTADWTPESVREMITRELLSSEIVSKAREAAFKECEEYAQHLLGKLQSQPFGTPEDFHRAAEEHFKSLQEQFGHLSEWAQPIFGGWAARTEEIFNRTQRVAEAQATSALRRIADAFFAKLGIVCPDVPVPEIVQEFEDALESRVFQLPLQSFLSPQVDIAGILQQYAAAVSEHARAASNIEAKIKELGSSLDALLCESARKVVKSIRIRVFFGFLVPDFVPETTHFASASVEELNCLVSTEYLLKNVALHRIGKLIWSKSAAAKTLFAKIMEEKGTSIQCPEFPELAMIPQDIDALSAHLHNLVPPQECLADIRIQCKEGDMGWKESYEDMLGRKFIAVPRGTGRVEGHKASWFTLAFFTPADRDSFLTIVGQNPALKANCGLKTSPSASVFAYLALSPQPGMPFELESMVRSIRSMMLSQASVLPLCVEHFTLDQIYPQFANFVVFALSLASAEDFSRVCGQTMLALGSEIMARPCPAVLVRGFEPSTLVYRLFASGFPFLSASIQPDGSCLVVLPAEPHSEVFVASTPNIFGPGATATPIALATPTPQPHQDEAIMPTRDAVDPSIARELWQDELFEHVTEFHSASDIDMITANKAWDPVVWHSKFHEFDKKARSGDPEGRGIWRNELLNGMRVLVASSTLLFLDTSGTPGGGRVKQIRRSKDDPTLIAQMEEIAAPNPAVGETFKIDAIAPPPAPRFRLTEVRVANMDSIKAALQLQQKFPGKRVAVLNMANSLRPGGGWRHGRTAQEESLFFRTALSSSLDPKFYANGGIGEFSCIYSRDVAVIRGDESNGFFFLPEAMQSRLDFVSVSAYNLSGPDANGMPQTFDSAKAARTRVKIEALFSACAAQGAEVLVLGALGCGAFRNPSLHIASIMRALIEQYAGCFSHILFAIYARPDDPKFADFANVLLDNSPMALQVCSTANLIHKVDAVFQNYLPSNPSMPRIATNVSLPICPFAGGCREVDPQHFEKEQHPPFCPQGDSCRDTNEFHRQLYVHRMDCPNFSDCPMMFHPDPAVVKAHERRFKHADLCPNGGGCQITAEHHLRGTLHPPLCEQGLQCPKKDDPEHSRVRRHLATPCTFGAHCARFNDVEHMQLFSHPFIRPCPNTPFDCTDTSRKHMQEFSHVCPAGPRCPQLNDPEHVRLFIHVGAICRAQNCQDLTDDHLSAYFHQNSNPFRPPCNETWCKNMDPEHRRKFSHPPPRLALSPVEMLSIRDPSGKVEDYGNFTADQMSRVPFFSNVAEWLKKLDDYLEKEGRVDVQSPAFREIVAWFENLRPVHMCSGQIFASMMRLGMAGSLSKLNSMWSSVQEILACALLRESIKRIASDNPEQNRAVCKFSKKYITVKQGEISKVKVPDLSAKMQTAATPEETGKIADIVKMFQRTPEAMIRTQRELREQRIALVSMLGEETVKKLEEELNEIVEALAVLVESAPGIGYNVDKETRTYHTVFTIVGPHTGDYGHAEVVLVMRPAIMWHPDFYMLPCAATSFYSGRYWHNGEDMVREAWMGGVGKAWQDGGKAALTLSKFHPMVPRWSEACAKEWICRVHVNAKVPVKSVTLPDVTKLWNSVNSHKVIEGHLPAVVPLDYVEHAIIIKPVLEKLRAEPGSQAFLQAWTDRFGPSFIEECADARAARVRSGQYLVESPCGIDKPTGLCFVVAGGSREQFCPFTLQNDGTSYLYFVAREGGLFLTLSNTGDLEDKTKKREVIVFYIEEGTGNLSVFSKPPMICRSDPPLLEMQRFNRSCPTKRFVHYMVQIDYNQRKVSLEHWGPSGVFNKLRAEISMPTAEPYGHISFASDKTQPQIWNLMLLKTRIPDVRLERAHRTPVQQLQPPPIPPKKPERPPLQHTGSAGQLGLFHTHSNSFIGQPQQGSPLGQPRHQHHQHQVVDTTPPSPGQPPHHHPVFQPPTGAPPSGFQPPIGAPPAVFSPPPGPPPPRFRIQGVALPICLHGQTCKLLGDPSHTTTHIHLRKPACTQQPCQQFFDPAHRLEFFHPNSWDLLIPCRDGARCTQQTNSDHCSRYHHVASFDYISIIAKLI